MALTRKSLRSGSIDTLLAFISFDWGFSLLRQHEVDDFNGQRAFYRLDRHLHLAWPRFGTKKSTNFHGFTEKDTKNENPDSAGSFDWLWFALPYFALALKQLTRMTFGGEKHKNMTGATDTLTSLCLISKELEQLQKGKQQNQARQIPSARFALLRKSELDKLQQRRKRTQKKVRQTPLPCFASLRTPVLERLE